MCALIAEGLQKYSTSKLHFCMNNPGANGSQYNASLNDSRMVLTRHGDVGIGTTSPGAKLDAQGSVTAVCYTSTSDTRIKTDQQQVPYDDCQQIFDNVEAKKYTRTDLEQQRAGFIAQGLYDVCKDEFVCIVGRLQSADMPAEEIDEEPLLTVDYSRLVTVLWGVCKNLQGRVAQLEQAANSSRNN